MIFTLLAACYFYKQAEQEAVVLLDWTPFLWKLVSLSANLWCTFKERGLSPWSADSLKRQGRTSFVVQPARVNFTLQKKWRFVTSVLIIHKKIKCTYDMWHIPITRGKQNFSQLDTVSVLVFGYTRGTDIYIYIYDLQSRQDKECDPTKTRSIKSGENTHSDRHLLLWMQRANATLHRPVFSLGKERTSPQGTQSLFDIHSATLLPAPAGAQGAPECLLVFLRNLRALNCWRRGLSELAHASAAQRRAGGYSLCHMFCMDTRKRNREFSTMSQIYIITVIQINRQIIYVSTKAILRQTSL